MNRSPRFNPKRRRTPTLILPAAAPARAVTWDGRRGPALAAGLGLLLAGSIELISSGSLLWAPAFASGAAFLAQAAAPSRVWAPVLARRAASTGGLHDLRRRPPA